MNDTLRSPSKFLIVGAFFIIYVAWGVSFLCIGQGVQSIGPLYFVALRWGLAGLILLTITGGWTRLPKRKELPRILISGLLLYPLGNGGVSLAMRWVPSGIAALIVATIPLWLLVIHWVLGRNIKYQWHIWPGILCGVSGVALLVFEGPTRDGEMTSRWPFVLLLGSSACWAAGTAYVTHHSKAVKILHDEIGFQMLAGGIMLFLASALSGETMVWPSSTTWVSLSYLVLIGSILGMVSYQYLLGHVSPVTVSTYAFVNPLVALFVGALFANERITLPTLISTALIVLSVLLLLKSGEPEEDLGTDA
jgi:drug/metabolite transporter (DMT)-like permease